MNRQHTPHAPQPPKQLSRKELQKHIQTVAKERITKHMQTVAKERITKIYANSCQGKNNKNIGGQLPRKE